MLPNLNITIIHWSSGGIQPVIIYLFQGGRDAVLRWHVPRINLKMLKYPRGDWERANICGLYVLIKRVTRALRRSDHAVYRYYYYMPLQTWISATFRLTT